MDPKNQNLTPELKQIYDRVMNTEVQKAGAPQGSAPQTPIHTSPATPVAPPATPVSTPASPAAMPPPTIPTANPHDVLSSAPPRPLTDDKTFVFNGSKITTPEGSTEAHAQAAPGTSKKISGKIIGLLVVVLVIVWGLFWAKLFGLI